MNNLFLRYKSYFFFELNTIMFGYNFKDPVKIDLSERYVYNNTIPELFIITRCSL